MNWKQDRNDFQCFNHSAIWGEHPGVCIILYEHDVHLKVRNYTPLEQCRTSVFVSDKGYVLK